jgi:hypothetical protein
MILVWRSEVMLIFAVSNNEWFGEWDWNWLFVGRWMVSFSVSSMF